jgi:diguanylate cyclase (GGDEF)-like protein
MATFVMAVLAGSVALGYFVIAIVVAPRIKMPSASSRMVLAIRGAAIAFFIGCGATHIHILVHTLGAAGPAQPVEPHEIVFHTMQGIGAWLFIAGAVMRLELHVVPSPQRAQLRAAVEEQRRLADYATQRASQDELTGLARRWRFDEELARQVACARRDGAAATLLLIDIDNLKHVNDTSGHHAGDTLLRHVAAAIRDEIRVSDVAARIGGDEFAVILPQTGADEAGTAAERIVAAVARPAPGGAAPASVSVGSAPISGLLLPADIMRSADVALYAAKREGGNCHVAGVPTSPPQHWDRRPPAPELSPPETGASRG